MASKFPYYQMYVDDFDDDDKVLSMNLAEVGLYVLCLNRSWVYGSLPDDAEEVSVLVRRKANDVRKSWPKVRACYFDRGDGRLVNRKQEELREKSAAKSNKASGSARSRWKEPDANAMRTHSVGTAKAVPRAYGSGSDSVSEIKTPSVALSETQPGYWAERWYERHPKKKDLVLVFPCTEKLYATGGLPLMRLIDESHRALCVSDEWLRDGGRFVPSLPRWLEDRGWTAPLTEATPMQGSKFAGAFKFFDEREKREN